MPEKKDILQETDDTARTLARSLINEAGYAALAVNEAETGFPFVSRVLMAADEDGAPLILISALATHYKAIRKDNRVALMTGEPGKGDPLAHPRLTTRCIAKSIARNSERYTSLRDCFLGRHPKAALYIDFPDFTIFRLEPQSASLNGGFGKAYMLAREDILAPVKSISNRDKT
ncbi:HugZ family protein [Martelella mediterranea]|uniref:CREG-like beta-barrel domain-containing protein n=1 Tax=Martelella mediterranea TaxID=293089 RepID=A0A4R3NEW4_9HYPH|nr:pyridoxamine 5'-phosphate oxidase family protein [Martelella mediterranea]TCT27574.1 hypothetical protein EDC90_10803 [Martelella mediterranea]